MFPFLWIKCFKTMPCGVITGEMPVRYASELKENETVTHFLMPTFTCLVNN